MVYLLNNYCIDRLFKDVKTINYEVLSSRCGFDELDSVEVPCERFDDFGKSEFCVMTKKTKINSTKFVIAELKDEDIEGIIFDKNKNIEYLSHKIYMQFPNLVKYWAHSCSIKEITKENFENLNRLNDLILSSNQIQKVSENTFHGLGNLQKVNLGKYLKSRLWPRVALPSGHDFDNRVGPEKICA